MTSKQVTSNEQEKWVIEASAPIDILSPEFLGEPEVKPAKKVRKPAAKKSKKESKPEEESEQPAVNEAYLAYYAQACQNIEESLQPYEEIEEPLGVMDSAIEDLEDEILALWDISMQARSEQIQRALLNRLQSEAIAEAKKEQEASDAIEAIALADSIPCYDAPLEDAQDEIDALLAREYSLRMQEKLAAEAEALHEENPLEAPSNEEIEAMALALQPIAAIEASNDEITPDAIEAIAEANAFIANEEASRILRNEQEGELTDRDFTQFVEKLEVMAESPASKAGKAKKASKPEKASNGQFWDNAWNEIIEANQSAYIGPCELPEGLKIPEDRMVIVTPEKGRIRYNLYGRIAECPGLWFKFGNIGGFWKAYRLADLQKWIEDRAGKEPFLMKEPNIPAARLGFVIPKPEKVSKPEKVTLPAGDISIKRADQKAMMAELRMLRHVNEINAYVSFGILPELTLEDSKAFKVMQAFLDSEKIWLFGFNEGEQASKDPYYAIEASDAQLHTLCEIFQIKRA